MVLGCPPSLLPTPLARTYFPVCKAEETHSRNRKALGGSELHAHRQPHLHHPPLQGPLSQSVSWAHTGGVKWAVACVHTGRRGDPRTMSSPHPSSIGGSHWLPPFPAGLLLCASQTQDRQERGDSKHSLTMLEADPSHPLFQGSPGHSHPQPSGGTRLEGPEVGPGEDLPTLLSCLPSHPSHLISSSFPAHWTTRAEHSDPQPPTPGPAGPGWPGSATRV